MIRAYDEIVDFIAAGTTPDSVARFEASPQTKERAAELLQKEKNSALTPEELAELNHFLQYVLLMRLANARASSFGPR